MLIPVMAGLGLFSFALHQIIQATVLGLRGPGPGSDGNRAAVRDQRRHRNRIPVPGLRHHRLHGELRLGVLLRRYPDDDHGSHHCGTAAAAAGRHAGPLGAPERFGAGLGRLESDRPVCARDEVDFGGGTAVM